MAGNASASNQTPPETPPTDEEQKKLDEQEAARVAEQEAADQKAADEKAAAEEAELQAKIKADKEAKKAEAAKNKAKPAAPKATPEVPPLDEAGAGGDDPAAALPKSQPRRPATKDRAQKFDLEALTDALPDDLYEAFVAGRSLNDQGVDVETGFDIKTINNPLLDSIRINLRNQGYFV